MRKILVGITLLLWILTACAAQEEPTEQPLLPNEDNSSADFTPAEQAALTALSKTLNLPVGQIALSSTEAVEWPDGCLGVQRIGVMCTQVIVPGYKIMLEANGKTY